MKSFEAENKNMHGRLIREMVITVVVIFGGTWALHYFSVVKLNLAIPVVELVVLAFHFGLQLARPRVQEVVFVPASKEIIFYYRNLFGPVKQKSTPFSETSVEWQRQFSFRRDRIVLHFIRGRFDLVKLSAHDDGFTPQAIEDIRQAAEAYGLKVSRY